MFLFYVKRYCNIRIIRQKSTPLKVKNRAGQVQRRGKLPALIPQSQPESGSQQNKFSTRRPNRRRQTMFEFARLYLKAFFGSMRVGKSNAASSSRQGFVSWSEADRLLDKGFVNYALDRMSKVEKRLSDAEDLLQVLKVDRNMREAQKRRGKWFWVIFDY